MDKKLVCLILSISLLSVALSVGAQGVQASSDEGIAYSSGVYLISPVNRTYTTNVLTLNLTFMQGLKCQLNYSIDGQYCGDIPLRVANESEIHIQMTEMTSEVPLPLLSDGTHVLTINVQANLNDFHGANPPGAPFKATNPEGTNFSAIWVHTVYFTVDTNNATPTDTAVATTSPIPTPTPTNQSTACSPTQTIQPPASEPQQSTPLAAILIVAASIAYIAVIMVLVLKKR